MRPESGFVFWPRFGALEGGGVVIFDRVLGTGRVGRAAFLWPQFGSLGNQERWTTWDSGRRCGKVYAKNHAAHSAERYIVFNAILINVATAQLRLLGAKYKVVFRRRFEASKWWRISTPPHKEKKRCPPSAIECWCNTLHINNNIQIVKKQRKCSIEVTELRIACSQRRDDHFQWQLHEFRNNACIFEALDIWKRVANKWYKFRTKTQIRVFIATGAFLGLLVARLR